MRHANLISRSKEGSEKNEQKKTVATDVWFDVSRVATGWVRRNVIRSDFDAGSR